MKGTPSDRPVPDPLAPGNWTTERRDAAVRILGRPLAVLLGAVLGLVLLALSVAAIGLLFLLMSALISD